MSDTVPETKSIDKKEAKNSTISEELRQVLQFTQDENQKHRDYFQMLYKWTAGSLTIIVVVIGALVAFVGWHTIDDIRKQAQAATDEEIRNIRKQSHDTLIQQTNQIQQQISTRLNDEFANPVIRETVKNAARDQTDSALLPIITGEVRSQVAIGVKSEQGNVKQALLAEVHDSVEQLKPTINKRVDETVAKSVQTSVSSQVDSQITPKIRILEENAELSGLINKAQADDAQAFDRLVVLATNPQSNPQYRQTAFDVVRSVIIGHSGPIRATRKFKDQKTQDEEIALLTSPDIFVRLTALDSLPDSYWKDHLDQLYAMMTTDNSLNIRSASYFRFCSISHYEADPLDNYQANQWWLNHRKDFVK